MRLDLLLITRHPELSRRRARDVIEKGQVSVGGAIVRAPGQDVPPDAVVRFDPNRKALPRARLSLPLLYQDDTLLVVDKPAGLLTVPSAPGLDHEDTALRRVREYVAHLAPRRPYVGVVHRIDRDTSGAVAFALTPASRAALRELFREHRIERRYAALVEGVPREDHGIVDRPLHAAYEGGRRRVARPDEPSSPALTRWRVVERFARAALLELELETGRQHQIRIHLAHLGTPVLGDAVYRAKDAPPPPVRVRRQMLHARVLAFVHPSTGAAVRVTCALPEDFERALSELRRRRDPAHGAGPRKPKRASSVRTLR
jgi:23S rRNA pseudouridine1911/1915/1917 synthase